MQLNLFFIVQIGTLFGQTIKALGSVQRIYEYTHLHPTIPLKFGKTLPNLQGTIQFNSVNFVYPTRPTQKILSEFNLTIPAGSVIALCGASGGGKSTIGQLIERFYDPTHGSITLDGVDIRTLDATWLRKNIGYINQEPVLFGTSIFENIRYGKPDASEHEVRDAARMANADEFIQGFKDGYMTQVGERGVSLSGGQKQRIAIARALLVFFILFWGLYFM